MPEVPEKIRRMLSDKRAGALLVAGALLLAAVSLFVFAGRHHGDPTAPGPGSEPTASVEGNRAAAERNRELAVEVVVLPSGAAPATSAPAARTIDSDGLYGGPICYGPDIAEAPRCFRAQGLIASGKIAGEWPGREAGITMSLVGEVSASGEIVLHIEGKKPDGAQVNTIDLTGSLKAGRLDAAGTFRNGRTATLNWRKAATASP